MLNLSVNKYRNSGGVGIWGGRDEREKECVSVCVCGVGGGKRNT